MSRCSPQPDVLGRGLGWSCCPGRRWSLLRALLHHSVVVSGRGFEVFLGCFVPLELGLEAWLAVPAPGGLPAALAGGFLSGLVDHSGPLAPVVCSAGWARLSAVCGLALVSGGQARGAQSWGKMDSGRPSSRLACRMARLRRWCFRMNRCIRSGRSNIRVLWLGPWL